LCNYSIESPQIVPCGLSAEDVEPAGLLVHFIRQSDLHNLIDEGCGGSSPDIGHFDVGLSLDMLDRSLSQMQLRARAEVGEEGMGGHYRICEVGLPREGTAYQSDTKGKVHASCITKAKIYMRMEGKVR
jgi:hypothetical protein